MIGFFLYDFIQNVGIILFARVYLFVPIVFPFNAPDLVEGFVSCHDEQEIFHGFEGSVLFPILPKFDNHILCDVLSDVERADKLQGDRADRCVVSLYKLF